MARYQCLPPNLFPRYYKHGPLCDYFRDSAYFFMVDCYQPITVGPRKGKYIDLSLQKPITVGPRQNRRITHCWKRTTHVRYETRKVEEIFSTRKEDINPRIPTIVTSLPIEPLEDAEDIILWKPKELNVNEAPLSLYVEMKKTCEEPQIEIQEKMFFLINNISSANIDDKAKVFCTMLKEQYYPWFAQYMVTKRAKLESNFQDLYLTLIDKVNSKALKQQILEVTCETCKNMLISEMIRSSAEERSLLNNLGSWLGKITIERNQALREFDINPRSLIIEAYETGSMTVVIPFIAKILESVKDYSSFQPLIPSTMDILGLLVEIYAMPNLKMNLIFAIEILFRNLGLDLKEVSSSSLLKGRVRLVEGNLDFSNKGRIRRS